MRSLGLASRALDLTLLRATDTRKATFGKSLFEHGTVVRDLAESRIEIDQARLLVLAAAVMVDEHPERAKGALREIGMAKVR
jgi:acyl-CoA dehydrogenase